MRVLRQIVRLARRDLELGVPDLFQYGFVITQSIGNDKLWVTIPFHRFVQKIQCSPIVTGCRDIGIQHFALMIGGAREIVCLSIDFHKHPVEVPSELIKTTHSSDALLADLGSEHRAEAIPLVANCFVADINPALVQ